MASVVLPFLMSMLLGRTIDLKTYTVGTDLFDPRDYKETPINVLNSTYNILQENVFPYAYIGVPADIVLRIKSHHLSSASGAFGLDGLLKETSWKSRSVTIAITSMVQTVYRELKEDAITISNWTNRIDRKQTHYAASSIYGGWSVVLYRFDCNNPLDEEITKEILVSTLGVTGVMNEKAVELMNSALVSIENNKDISEPVKVSVKRYSSVSLVPDVSTPEKLWIAIQNFQAKVGKLGQPLFVELLPLRKLDTRYPLVTENHKLDQYLEKLDELFDDVRQTKASMRHWLSTSVVEFSSEDEKKVDNLYQYVSQCVDLFDAIASKASIYNSMDVSYMKLAMLKYGKGLPKGADSYLITFKRMKEDLDPQCEDVFLHKITGLLNVNPEDKMELGEMERGLEECKEECIAEPKCRAIAYAEDLPILGFHSSTLKRGLEIIRKYKQCWIFFRSSNTVSIIPSKRKGPIVSYDRKCY